MFGCACVPVKFYLQEEVAGHSDPLSPWYSLCCGKQINPLILEETEHDRSLFLFISHTG